MVATSDLKLFSDCVIFRFAKKPINNNKFKRPLTLNWKCLATIVLMSTLSTLFNFFIISINPSHLRSAHDNVRKKVGGPNCYTFAKTSDLNFVSICRCSFDWFHKRWSFSSYSRTTSMKLVLLKISAFNARVEFLRIATFICFCIFRFCKTLCVKKVFCIICKFLTKMKKLLVEIFHWSQVNVSFNFIS